MRAGVPGQQPLERPDRGPEERLRHARRRRDADAVPVARDVLHRDPALLAADPGPHRAPRGRELGQVERGLGPPAGGPRPHLVRRQVAEAPQEVVDLVRVVGVPLVDERLEAQLEVRERVGVEQLPQLLLAQQLAQQVAVQREGLRPALRQRRVALVHVGGDVVEQERAREGRRPRGLDAVDGDLAPPDAVEDLAQGAEVEHVGEALAVRLDEDREAAVPRGHREQVRRPLALLPQRRPRARAAASAGGAPAPRSRGTGWRTGSTAPTRPTTRSSTSSGSGNSSASTPSRLPSPSGSRIAMPSSDQIVWTSSPSRSWSLASSAIVHGAWTRPPNGVSTTSRQSPSSSRNRSTTIRRSVGRTPVASRSSSR